MKNLTLLLLTFFVSIGWAQTPLSQPGKLPATKQKTESDLRLQINNMKPEHRQSLGRVVSFLLLNRVKTQLDAFSESHDPKDLNELLKAWSKEEQIEIKKELMASVDKPILRVQGSSLFVTLHDETVELSVQDPFEGVFRINGQLIRINPATKYRYFKEQFDALAKVSSHRHPWFDLFLPDAKAGIGDAILKIGASIAKYVRPAGPATASELKENALKTGDNVGDMWLQMGREERAAAKALEAKEKSLVRKGIKWTAGVGALTVANFYGNSIFSCAAFGWDWDTLTNKCIKNASAIPAKILCDKEIKVEGCVDTVGALDSVKVTTGAKPPPVPTLLPSKGCVPTPDNKGYTKDLTLRRADGAEVARLQASNPNAPLPPAISTTSIQLVFEKDPDPKSKKINKKSMTEVVTSNRHPTKDKVIEQRVWTYTDDKNWTIMVFGALKDGNGNFLDVSKVPTQTLKCSEDKLNEGCKTLYDEVIGVMGTEKNCGDFNKNSHANQYRGIQEGTKSAR